VAMDSDPSAQGPTEALTSGDDPVSEAQRALDGEGTQQPDYIGKAQFDSLTAKFNAQEAQLRGLQGVIDRSNKTLSAMTSDRQTADHAKWIAQQPEDQQPILEYLHQQQQQTRQEMAELKQAVQSQGGASVEPSEQAKAFVEASGVNPNTPGIDYAAYDGTDAGTWAFIRSIEAVQGNGATTPAIQAPSTPRPQPPSPGETPASGGAGSLTQDDIMAEGVKSGNWTKMNDDLRRINSPLARN